MTTSGTTSEPTAGASRGRGGRAGRGTRSFPVTVTRMPVVRCALCGQTLAHRGGQAAVVLTAHYEQAHAEGLPGSDQPAH